MLPTSGSRPDSLEPGNYFVLRGLKGSVVALAPGGRPGYLLFKVGVGRGQILGYTPSPCFDIYRCAQTLESWAQHMADPVKYASMLREHARTMRNQLKLLDKRKG